MCITWSCTMYWWILYYENCVLICSKMYIRLLDDLFARCVSCVSCGHWLCTGEGRRDSWMDGEGWMSPQGKSTMRCMAWGCFMHFHSFLKSYNGWTLLVGVPSHLASSIFILRSVPWGTWQERKQSLGDLL